MWVAVKVVYQNTASVLMTEYGQIKMEAGIYSECWYIWTPLQCVTQGSDLRLPTNTSQCIALLNGISSKYMRCASNIGQLAATELKLLFGV